MSVDNIPGSAVEAGRGRGTRRATCDVRRSGLHVHLFNDIVGDALSALDAFASRGRTIPRVRLGGGSRAWARHATCDVRRSGLHVHLFNDIVNATLAALDALTSRGRRRTTPGVVRRHEATCETQSGDGPSPSESATGHQAMRDGNVRPEPYAFLVV